MILYLYTDWVRFPLNFQVNSLHLKQVDYYSDFQSFKDKNSVFFRLVPNSIVLLISFILLPFFYQKAKKTRWGTWDSPQDKSQDNNPDDRSCT